MIGKLSKRTVAALEAALADTGIVDAMQSGGVMGIRVEATSGPNKPKGWTAAMGQDGMLIIHPRTADAIAKSTVPERRDGGLRRVLWHESAHGIWNRADARAKQQFAAAITPEVRDRIAKIVSLGKGIEGFNTTSAERETSEVHAEVQAMKRYAPGEYAQFPESVRNAADAVWASVPKLPEHLLQHRVTQVMA